MYKYMCVQYANEKKQKGQKKNLYASIFEYLKCFHIFLFYLLLWTFFVISFDYYRRIQLQHTYTARFRTFI